MNLFLSKCSYKEYQFWKHRPAFIITQHLDGRYIVYQPAIKDDLLAGAFYNWHVIFPLLSINASAGYYEISIEELPSRDGYIVKRVY